MLPTLKATILEDVLPASNPHVELASDMSQGSAEGTCVDSAKETIEGVVFVLIWEPLISELLGDDDLL